MNRFKYVLVALLVVVAGVLLMRNVVLRPSPTPRHTQVAPNPDTTNVQRVEAASGDLRDLADLRRDPEGTRSTLRSRILDHRTLIPHAPEQLAEAAASRLMLYIDPDFNEYVRQIVAFSGREPDFTGRRLQALEFTPENWKAVADVSGPKRLAIGQLRLRTPSEHEAARSSGAYRRDGYQDYSRLDPTQANLRRISIELPATLPAIGGGTYEGFFVLTFAWDASRRTWVPIFTSAEDPSQTASDVFTPWF